MSEPLWRSRPDAFVMHPATTVRHQAINDFIYLSEGYSNSFLVVTPAGRVVINTGMGFEAPVHKAYFDSIDAGPVKYIVLTQGHVDHVGVVTPRQQIFSGKIAGAVPLRCHPNRELPNVTIRVAGVFDGA